MGNQDVCEPASMPIFARDFVHLESVGPCDFVQLVGECGPLGPYILECEAGGFTEALVLLSLMDALIELRDVGDETEYDKMWVDCFESDTSLSENDRLRGMKKKEMKHALSSLAERGFVELARKGDGYRARIPLGFGKVMFTFVTLHGLFNATKRHIERFA